MTWPGTRPHPHNGMSPHTPPKLESPITNILTENFGSTVFSELCFVPASPGVASPDSKLLLNFINSSVPHLLTPLISQQEFGIYPSLLATLTSSSSTRVWDLPISPHHSHLVFINKSLGSTLLLTPFSPLTPHLHQQEFGIYPSLFTTLTTSSTKHLYKKNFKNPTKFSKTTPTLSSALSQQFKNHQNTKKKLQNPRKQHRHWARSVIQK